MSEVISLVFLLAQAVPVLYAVGAELGRSSERPAVNRHLLRQDTQITDRESVQNVLEQLGLRYQAGDPHKIWGAPVEIQIFDDQGKPWFALARDETAKAYMIYWNDPASPQTDIPETLRLSEQDPSAIVGRLTQQYGYLRTVQTLLKQGYKPLKTVEVGRDGSQTLVLTRDDPKSGETHTVRLVFKTDGGQATIMTDSQKADGSHGVCPDLSNILKSIGIEHYGAVMSPASPRVAKQKDHSVEKGKNRSGKEQFEEGSEQNKKAAGS